MPETSACYAHHAFKHDSMVGCRSACSGLQWWRTLPRQTAKNMAPLPLSTVLRNSLMALLNSSAEPLGSQMTRFTLLMLRQIPLSCIPAACFGVRSMLQSLLWGHKSHSCRVGHNGLLILAAGRSPADEQEQQQVVST